MHFVKSIKKQLCFYNFVGYPKCKYRVYPVITYKFYLQNINRLNLMADINTPQYIQIYIQKICPLITLHSFYLLAGLLPPVSIFYASIILCIQSPHIIFTCFVALTLLPQQGQVYFLWWLFGVTPVGLSSPPLLACVPIPIAVNVGFALHISISLNSVCSSTHSSKLSAGAVCA